MVNHRPSTSSQDAQWLDVPVGDAHMRSASLPTASTFCSSLSSPGMPQRAASPVSVDADGTWQAKHKRWMPNPETLTGRTLVVAADGTADEFDTDNSNIVKLVSLLQKDDPNRQKVYYQSGVGTYSGPGAAVPGAVSQAIDYMVANTLGDHVRDAYEFLMEHYAVGDKICLFGFSRGAYTVRALAGMLQKVGLLAPGNKQSIRAAYKLYAREDAEGLDLCRDFKRSFATDVKIQFVGVFDTVASVGLSARTLPFVATNNSIRFFRHALALDEHRAKFMPAYYKVTKDGQDTDDIPGLETQRDSVDSTQKSQRPSILNAFSASMSDSTRRRKIAQRKLYIDEQNMNKGPTTNSKEVWFTGSHTDVGGGSVPNHTRHALARIPLRWMIRECFEAQTGLIFDMDRLHYEVGLGIDFNTRELLPVPPQVLPLHDRDKIRKPEPEHRRDPSTAHLDFKGEALEELFDALSPIYDRLAISPGWWVLEMVPLVQMRQRVCYEINEMSDDFVWMINRGRGRKVFEHVSKRGIHVHRSVLARLLAQDHEGKPQTYVPQIRPNLHALAGGRDIHTKARRMSWAEWESQEAGLVSEWFKWVDLVDADRKTPRLSTSDLAH